MDLTYFNPNSQKEADFLLGFVARQRTLDFFLKHLQLVPANGSARHHLIVAPRGFGKTSLLRRIAIGVQADEHLNGRFIALRFREEQHNVISLDVFWRNCLQSLAEAREDEGASADEIAELDTAWATHAPRQNLTQKDQDGEPAWQILHAYCERLERRPLLLIDNLDTLLAGLGDHHQWGLRKRLQSDDGPIMIAAASRYPAATHDTSAAFYEFFRIQPLDKLDDQEVFTCLRNLALHRGAAGRPVLTLLDKTPGRVAALNTLSGGNPRTLSVLYGVLESHMSADVLSQLSAMLDTFTGWYQARTEELPMQARAVFDALALNWDPMTAAALGLATGLDTSAVSSQLTRLEKSGYVEPVALNRRGKGRSGYQVSERFFNIWYLMRNGPRRAKQSIRFLTTFLQSCFSSAERRSLAAATLENNRCDPGYALALASSLNKSPLRQQLIDQASKLSNEMGQANEYGPLIDELRKEEKHKYQTSAGNNTPLDTEEHLRLCEVFLTLVGTPTELTQLQLVAETLVNKGLLLASLDRLQQAIETYDDVILRFNKTTDPSIREQVAMALIHKAGTLGMLGQSEKAIDVYDTIDSRFGTTIDPILQQQVAAALINKGGWLQSLNRSEQAIDVYEDVIHRYATTTDNVLREGVARAFISKGLTFGNLGLATQEINSYDNAINYIGITTEPVLQELLATALINKSIILGQHGQPEQSIKICNFIVSKFGNNENLLFSEITAKALINKAIRLGELDLVEQEVEVYDNIIDRFFNNPELLLQENVARALINKGVAFSKSGRLEDSIKIYDDVIKNFGKSQEITLREGVARALVNKGISLGVLDQFEKEIEVYNNVIANFRMETEPAIREQFFKATYCKADALLRLNRLSESEAVYRSAIELEVNSIEFHMGLGNLLFDFMGQSTKALEAFEHGLHFAKDRKNIAILHANMAYVIALRDGDRSTAKSHAENALKDETSISPAGRKLLEALPIWHIQNTPDWSYTFEKISHAVICADPALWSSYQDDLERLLYLIIIKKQGLAFKEWMESLQFQEKYAPLYHAFVAALEGEDHLFQINPETRQPAMRIYKGIARRLKFKLC